MNKNNIIGFTLIIALVVGYSIWTLPSKKELAERQRITDSIAKIKHNDSVATALAKQQAPKKDSIAQPDPTKHVGDSVQNGFVAPANVKEDIYIVENDLIKLNISSKGGRVASVELKDYKTFDGKPLILFQKDSTEFGFEFNTEDLRTVNTNELIFSPAITNVGQKISGNGELKFAVRCYPLSKGTKDENKYIEYIYTLKGNEYMIGYTVNFVGMQGIMAQNTRSLPMYWNTTLEQKEKHFTTEQTQTGIYYQDATGEVDDRMANKDKTENLPATKWVAYKQQFFTSTLIAADKFNSVDIGIKHFADSKKKEITNKPLAKVNSVFMFDFKDFNNQTYNMKWYFGPTKYKTLRQYHLNLEKQIPLGWSFFLMQWINRGAVLPVFNWLETFHINYGIIILILTILLKIALFPIAWKTYISSAKMRILKPEVEEIAAKYPKPEDAMKKQQATMALYKRAGVSPMSGCLPLLLQMPILIAFFRFFPSAIELRQQPFLWATDLSSYDSVWNLPFNIPFYGDHVSLFTLLMTVTTIIYTKINNDMMGSTNQMPGMKLMMYLMPIMFLGIFNNYSSGLSYYYFLANIFTFAQMFFIRRFVNEDKLHARIQENKAKPVKKSSFQKRLEEIAKNQQQQKQTWQKEKGQRKK